MSYYSRLTKAFQQAPVLPITERSRYVLISDCHRGNGTRSDNFLKNQNLYFAALSHYYEEDYTYIEMGDGDELWENRSMGQITEIHSNVFWLLNKFHQQNRLYMLYGNHDIIKKRKGYLNKSCQKYPHASVQEFQSLLKNSTYYSGVILADKICNKELYLTHGHQASLLNSTLWPLARFLVRYVWSPLEHLGFNDPTSAAKNNTRKKKAETRLAHWAKTKDHILITGHTHRPMLGTPDSPYFNTGSCVHPRCITCIEIENRCFHLVKWTIGTRPDRTLFVSRVVLAPPICIDHYCQGK